MRGLGLFLAIGCLVIVSSCSGSDSSPEGSSHSSAEAGSTGSESATAGPTAAPSISRTPTDLPAPIRGRPPQFVTLELEAVELEGRLAEGSSYQYWTFNQQVPGPFLRVRVGDTVELTLKNRQASQVTHSIDLHAVTGPGGGSSVLSVTPGEQKTLTFKAIKPGIFVYHCATASIAHHIANGMYGLILVEPEGGLSRVDREFYVMQGELYTTQPFGSFGLHSFKQQKILDEAPEYVLLNGAVGALTTEHPLEAKVGETVRIFFGVGGPNLTSAFHIIGEHLDRVAPLGSLTSPDLTTVQTTVVPPGGATMVELKVEVPGTYLLVDHALARLERGLVGHLKVEGPENPELFREGGAKKAQNSL